MQFSSIYVKMLLTKLSIIENWCTKIDFAGTQKETTLIQISHSHLLQTVLSVHTEIQKLKFPQFF